MQTFSLRPLLRRLPAFATRCLTAGLALAAAFAAPAAQASHLLYAPHDSGTVTRRDSADGSVLPVPFPPFLPGSLIGGLSGGHDIARTPQGDLIIARTSENKVSRYTSTGELVVDRLFGIGSPTAVAVSPDGLVYVASGSRVAIYNTAGALVSNLFIEGLQGPVDLAIDYKGEVLYIAESTGNVVSSYSLPTGEVINEALVSVTAPRAVAVSHSGALYVASGSSVTRHDAETGAPSLAFNLTGLASPSRLAINNNLGRLYVASSAGSNRVGSYSLASGAVVTADLITGDATDASILVQESGSQTIYLPEDNDIIITNGTSRLRATSTSGLPIRYEILSGFEFVEPLADRSSAEPNSSFKPLGVGTVNMRASQSGGSGFAAADPVVFSFDVIKAPQTITFADIADIVLGSGLIVPDVRSNSGLAVTLTLDGPATNNAGIIEPTGAGTLTITASQAGNAFIAAAEPVIQVIEILKKPQAISFAAPGPRAFGSRPFALVVEADSDLPVTLQVTGPATLDGLILTITGPGDIQITASQAGDATYAPAVDVVRNITASAALQTISFPAQSLTFGGAPVTLAAVATSGLPVSFTYISGPGILDGTTLTPTDSGTIVIEATQEGSSAFAAATPVRTNFVVGPRGNVINFPAVTGATFGSPPVTLGATATSGLTVAYSVISGPGSVAGNQLTITAAGPIVVEATQAGATGISAAAPVRRTITAAKAAQTITFAEFEDATFGDDPIALGATASSGLAIVYTLDSGPGAFDGANLLILGSGEIVVRASQPGDAGTLAADPVVRTLVVAKSPQLITFAELPGRTYALPRPAFNLAATAASGLPVTFSVVEGPATVQGSVLTLTGAGSVTIRATQAGNPNYLAAEPVDRTFTTAKAAQTIAFSPPATRTFSDVGVTLGGTASSGLPLAYEIVSGPATVSEGVLTFTGAGSVVVRASQTGDADWLAATAVPRTITASRSPQVITFATPADRLLSDPAADLAATTTSGLTVAFTIVSGPATLEGTTLVPTGTGTVLVRATQPGNDNFLAASPVQRSFRIAPAVPPVEFAFPALTDRTFGDAPVTLSATSTSEFPVTFAVVSGPATLDGSTLTLTGAGSVTVRATLGGESSVPPIERTFTVAKAALVVTARDEVKLAGTANPAFTFSYSGFVGADTEAALLTLPVIASTALPASPVGQYPITLSGGSAANYTLTLVPGVLRVVTFSGPYEALLYSGAFKKEVRVGSRLPAGKVEVTVPSTGTRLTGRLLLAGEAAALPFTGNLVLSEEQGVAVATINLVGRPSTNRYRLVLAVGAAGLEVTLSKNEEIIARADVEDAAQLFVSAPNRLAPWAGAHTLLLDSPAPLSWSKEDTEMPAGAGFATATINTAGLLTLTGRLPDGTALSGTAKAGVDGTYRLFLKPYGNRLDSVVAGRLDLELHPDINNRYISARTTGLVWTKAPGARDASYRQGIPATAFESVLLDPWRPTVRATNLAPAILLADRLGLDFESSVTLDFDLPVESSTEFPEAATLTAANRIVPVGPSPTPFTLTVKPATGLFSGAVTVRYLVGEREVTRSVKFSGILRQPTEEEILEGEAFIGAGFITLPGVPAATTGAIRLFTTSRPSEPSLD